MAEQARGRAIVCTQSRTAASNTPLYEYIIVDIHGTAIRESIEEEIATGRLVKHNLIDPGYIQMQYPSPLPFTQLVDQACDDSRDLILDEAPRNQDHGNTLVLKNRLEKVATQYMTIYTETLYLRTIYSIRDELFKSSRGLVAQPYLDLLLLTYLLHLQLRAYREEDQQYIDDLRQQIQGLHYFLPGLNISSLLELMAQRSFEAWEEITTRLDAYFLSLRVNHPLNHSPFAQIIENPHDQIYSELQYLYFEFFNAIEQEEYEKAQEFKLQIDHYNETLEGCRE